MIFSDLNFNCSNLLYMRNLQKQVKKSFCCQKLFCPVYISGLLQCDALQKIRKQQNLSFRFRQTKYPQNGSMTKMPICRTKVGILCKKKREKKTENIRELLGNKKCVSILPTFLSLLRSLSVAACLLSTRTTFFLQALQAHNRHCC